MGARAYCAGSFPQRPSGGGPGVPVDPTAQLLLATAGTDKLLLATAGVDNLLING